MSPPVINPTLTQASMGEDNHRALLADEIVGLPKRKKLKLTIMQLDKAKYELVGRKVMCLVDPFGSPTTTISVRLWVDSGHKGDLDMESDAITWQLQFYHAILTHAQGLEDELAKMDASELRVSVAGMSNQCSTDLGSIKHAGLTYVLCDGETFNPPIGKGEDKTTCGFNHPQIAHLLCPWKKLESFDEDPDIQAFLWVNVTADSDDDISAIHAQCACKAKCLSMLKAIEFGMPPPPEAPEPEARPSASFTAFGTISRQESPDLTPCPLDEEDESLIAKMTNTIPSRATSTAVNAAQSARTSAGSTQPSNIIMSKKAITPRTKQPCQKTTKKKNGF
ncbi:hypothetical protein EDC04DRAFT_2898218 [Pisolithus marmoratus]|nr:hypothetical protein EDC04DRAFT_2898218 [Pisolithus marmoratus]